MPDDAPRALTWPELCAELRAHVALMRAAGHTKLPLRFEVIEALITEFERRERASAAE